jgi:lipopolysaccharide transport system ATP-binding protein
MSTPAISIEQLSKAYMIGSFRGPYGRLSESVWEAIRHPKARFRRPTNKEIWALRDITLDVMPGEVVGIIGRNGAGKTTLLKILSRVTEPSSGTARMSGRVGSLLEVGTGFHPELTGRENVYLNGSVLGMRRAEVERRFDEIVAFAEIGEFLDTPVKRYSSGMQVRLAFAVAAHLEPDIVLVDEVLAVGDLAFQKKCLGKMSDVSQEGRTVLFVSHQMNQIRRLCSKVAWIEDGTLKQLGETQRVIAAYEKAVLGTQSSQERTLPDHARARFLSWRIHDGDSPNTYAGDPLRVEFQVEFRKSAKKVWHGVALFDSESQLIWGNGHQIDLPAGKSWIQHVLDTLPLRPGAYRWQVSMHDDHGLVDIWECLPEMIIATVPLAHRDEAWAGILNIPSTVEVRTSSE